MRQCADQISGSRPGPGSRPRVDRWRARWRGGFVLAVAALAGVTGCKEKTELYCCSTPASCERSGGGDTPVPCPDADRPFCDDEGAFPASDGIKNTCIPDPGELPDCEDASECTDPARPLCEGGRCVACAGPADCDAEAPVCDADQGECVGCTLSDDCAAHGGTSVCGDDGRCVACAGPADCDAGAPVCDDDEHTCRACAVDAECDAGACDRIDGTCVPEEDVLFVVPGGEGAMCTANLPCGSLAEAAAAATGTRTMVRMAAGTYTGTTTLAGVTLRVFGDPGTVLRPTGVKSTETLVVEGSSEVLLHGVDVRGTGGGDAFAAIRCRLDDGAPTLRILQSTVQDAPGLGIEASNCTLVVEQTVIRGNAGGGISASGGTFTIVNSFVVQNGGAGSLVGGASVSGGLESRFEHNTVTGNVRSAGAIAGLQCVGSLLARNNIISGNSNGAAEVSEECTHRFSVIGPEPEPGKGNLADAPTFVDASSGDFHLMAGSIGIDQGEPSTITQDVDGEPRPQGRGADIGADEVPAP